MKQKKKRKLNILKIILFLLILYLLGYGGYFLYKMPIKHIRVLNTNILNNDQIILEQAKIDHYPIFFLTTKKSIINRLKKNKIIKDVRVEKKWGLRVDIYIDECKILFYDKLDNTFILENKEKLTANHLINDVPILINYVPDTIYNDLVLKMMEIDDSIKIKISEIQYKPNDVDKERFLLTLNDGNYVYLTLYKFTKINEYNNIFRTLENKKGILYLDSGNYFEILE